MIPVHTRGGTTRLSLPATLDISAADDLHSALRKAVYRGRPVEIDCSQVSRLSTACAQILLAADLGLSQVDLRMTVRDCSEEFEYALSDLGLYEKLESWRAES